MTQMPRLLLLPRYVRSSFLFAPILTDLTEMKKQIADLKPVYHFQVSL
jgi:hypothetical protein